MTLRKDYTIVRYLLKQEIYMTELYDAEKDPEELAKLETEIENCLKAINESLEEIEENDR